jgi:menaquinone-dependent protoporphyrinogen oxidase
VVAGTAHLPEPGADGAVQAASAPGHVLVAYSTVDGHTRKICERLQQSIEAAGHRVTLLEMRDAHPLDLTSFDKIVIGASIRYGHHRPFVREFIDAHLQALATRPSAFFSVNIVARKPGKNQPDTNPYLRKFLGQIRWRPRATEVFAGKLDYPRYRFIDRQMIRFIMLVTGGPTDPATVAEFTDWQRVEAFARRVAAM